MSMSASARSRGFVGLANVRAPRAFDRCAHRRRRHGDCEQRGRVREQRLRLVRMHLHQLDEPVADQRHFTDQHARR
jgi:hypothetical protein